MSQSSTLRVTNWKTASGNNAMAFGAGGSITFQGSYQPNAFAFSAWDGADNRPTGVPIGAAGWNSKSTRLEIYHGVDDEGNPLWAVFKGTQFNPTQE